MNGRKVPELSLLSYVNGTNSDKTKFVDDLTLGLKDYGFIILKEHTIEQAKIDHAYEMVKEFFKLPLETKLKYQGNNGGQRGYTPFKTEHAKNNINPDLKEFWHVGREVPDDHQFSKYYPKNIWPDDSVPEFRPVFEKLFSQLEELTFSFRSNECIEKLLVFIFRV